MNAPWISLAVFAACYLLFVVMPHRRSIVACGGGALLILTGVLTWREALVEMISWNVVALFFGTLILADLFMQSRMPAILAEWFVDRTRTVRGAMIAICILAGGLSAFVENVAVVLLIAPVAVSMAEKLKINPVRLLVCIACCTNLQGTATLIGDPPSMILAGYMKMTFNDFFVYHGKPGIFFAIQIGNLAAMFVVALLLRRHRERVQMISVEKVKSWVPSLLLFILVVGLSLTSVFDPDFKWLAGTMTLVLAAVGLVWFRLIARWGSARHLLRTLDWDTTFFLIGVFVVVGALSASGWLDKLAALIASVAGSNLLLAFVVIVAVSMIISGFVDNVPFLLAMIPVTQRVADTLGAPVPVLLFGLLIGACVGGNLTPIGASANVVTVGLLKKHGHLVSFRDFMSVGIPFTLASVAAASCFVWWIWAP